jgi:hypothetical protein
MSKYKIEGPFVGHTREMLKSPTFRSLSLTALRILARIEIEHMDHGGGDNGKLPVTYRDFVEHGVTRGRIGGAIRELVATGFIEVTRKGRAGNDGFRDPSLYGLTYVRTKTSPPTNEWKQAMEASHADKNRHRHARKDHRKDDRDGISMVRDVAGHGKTGRVRVGGIHAKTPRKSEGTEKGPFQA